LQEHYASGAALEIPILIVQGTTDTQVGVADAQLLAAAKSDAQLLVIEGMCHVLKQATSDSADQQRAYTDPSVGLSEPLVRGVIGFVHATGPRSY
jgi:fermentation-respiration switch protein FrsA (DUF1100 family)